MKQELLQDFSLGSYRVSPLTGTIDGPGGQTRVSAKAMEVLLCLADTPLEVVERGAIAKRVWGGEDAVANDTLTHCVSELRHALDDHWDNPRVIQTLTRRGYRLLVKPEPVFETAAEAAPPDTAAADDEGLLLRFFHELRNRKVVRAATFYLLAAWLVIQVVEATFEPLLIPKWVNTTIIILLIAGFPVTIVLAWLYEMTPGGLERDRGTGRAGGRNRWLDFAMVGGIVIVVGAFSYQLIGFVSEQRAAQVDERLAGAGDAGPAFPIHEKSIAVLPFVNMSGGEETNDYFSDGLSEEILNLLARLRELRVASRTSAFSFKDKDVELRTIGRRLGVKHVLEGSVRRDGDNVRITAQLVDAETGFQLWSENYDRKLEDIFTIQDDIAGEIVRQLEIILSPESDAQMARRSPPSVEAYDDYLQGLAKLRGPSSPDSMEQAEAFFRSALATDPAYAEAYAGLCEVHLRQYRFSRDTRNFEQAERACNRALTLEQNATPVHIALGNLYRESGQHEKAETQFEAALRINPNAVPAYLGRALNLYGQNRLDEAESAFKELLTLHPQHWRSREEFAKFLFQSGRPDDAIEQYRYLTDVTPENMIAHNGLGAAYFMLGEFEEAAAAWRKSLALAPSRETYSNLGSSYFYADRFTEAVEMYRMAVEITPDDYLVWGNLGDAYTALADAAELAAAAYEKAIDRAQERLEVNPEDADALAALGHYYARLGRRDDAVLVISRATKLAPQDLYVWYDAAVAWCTLGEQDKALDAIERAVSLGYPRRLLGADAGLEPIRGYERFAALDGD